MGVSNWGQREASEARRPILYVDDEDNNLTVFEAAFEDDYDVYTAIGGEEALKIIEDRPIHVLVTDMRMPGMSGVDLLERVRPNHPDMGRIVLTGYTDVESIIRAINLGQVHQYVTKPWDERALKMIIDRSLDHYAEAQRQVQLTAELAAAIRTEDTVRQVFQRFVPPGVADDLLRSSEGDARMAGAESRDVTLLFADIRGFTALCAGHPPPLILSLLNDYFALMTEIIDENSGTVNQFLGDAVLAVFGAPMEVVDSTRCAVRAALQMIEAIGTFNERAMELVGQPIHIGIGLQKGVVSVGVVTAQDRSFYCAAGAPVNEVMLVEYRSKGHHNSIVITEDVRIAAGSAIEVVPFDKIRFPDSDGDVPLYRVSGMR
jgi:adenylate cyclase